MGNSFSAHIYCSIFLLIFCFTVDSAAQEADEDITRKIVTYGDSLLAGFIDGSLVETYQPYSFAHQLAGKTEGAFTAPLIEFPGIPALRLVLTNGFVDLLLSGEPGERKDAEADINNFAVPGASVVTALRWKNMGAKAGDDPDIYKAILGGKHTMYQSVKRSKPSLVIFWIGSNDVLGMVLNADVDDHTRLKKFRRLYKRTVDKLLQLDVPIVAANLPDITVVPYLLNTDDWTILRLFGLGSDEVIPATVLLDFLATGKIPALNDSIILDADELAAIRTTVEEFNQEIDDILTEAGIPYIDIYSLTQRWDKTGRTIAGTRLTMGWQGGLFSLDGVHPTFTGHALIANEFIELINDTWGTDIRRVNVKKVMQIDPNITGTRIASNEEKRLRAARALAGIRQLRTWLAANRPSASGTNGAH